MAAEYWLRLWTETPNDPKFRSVARIAGQPLTTVLAVFMHMMCWAKKAEEQGTLSGWVDEDIAAALDLESEQVVAIRSAMQGKLLDGDSLTGWAKRQPNRDDDSRERVARYREKKKAVTDGNAESNADVTQCNAPETETELEKELDNEDKKTSSSLSPQPDKIPYAEIVAEYHKICTLFPPIIKITTARRKAMHARWDPGKGLTLFREVFQKAAASDFLTGKIRSPNHPKFKADFDFILSPEKWVRILEGKYDNGSRTAYRDISAGNVAGPEKTLSGGTVPKRFWAGSVG